MLHTLRKRYDSALALLPSFPLRSKNALRGALREGYSRGDLRADVLAGLVVGVVALPLSMALAVASGVAPQHGLYTAIVAGAVIALLGGSRTQVSGPTAAFVVVLVPIAERFGVGGLLLATFMAGMILVGLGVARLGRLIEFIPHPVTTGFTAGIAVVIATLQLKDFLGLHVEHFPEHYPERVAALARAMPTARPAEIGIGALTLALLLFWPRVNKRIPAPLVALAAAGVAAALLGRLGPDFEVATIGTRFSYLVDGTARPGIPQLPPMPGLPWRFPGPDGQQLTLSLDLIRQLLPSAFAIALLGAIESLLSAVVADGMAGTKHDPDTELVAQGVGNMMSPIFGGIAATGAIARTATNIRAGARTPIAALVHALFVLASVLALAPLLAHLPMAALAAQLLVVAWNMSEAKHFVHTLRVAPKSDVFVQLACFSLTIVFDMVIAVTAGVILAALLFMRRMAEISGGRLLEGHHEDLREPLPPGVALYRIAGPLFFGATQKAMSSLDAISAKTRAILLDVTDVPVMDATGLVSLESALERLMKARVVIFLAGLQDQPRRLLEKAEIAPIDGQLLFFDSVEEAAARARAQFAPAPPASTRPPSSTRPPR
ncbi:C4-dicarboxylic acid transporter DauA [Sorangium sp. So ce1036]|uniref:C4-dicarboxylic acid transporter DauA n=1 Tax=Sorangium sp. So ce1036 TaxID=3133328 RepID=UPI003F10EE0C